jgi:hypothetical protein
MVPLICVKKFIPILKPGGRVVNVSSIACNLGGFRDEELRAKMAAAGEGTIEGLDALIERYRVSILGLGMLDN